jgi:hypothetical protein
MGCMSAGRSAALMFVRVARTRRAREVSTVQLFLCAPRRAVSRALGRSRRYATLSRMRKVAC